jgi:hypothetical protein
LSTFHPTRQQDLHCSPYAAAELQHLHLTSYSLMLAMIGSFALLFQVLYMPHCRIGSSRRLQRWRAKDRRADGPDVFVVFLDEPVLMDSDPVHCHESFSCVNG